MNQKKKLGAPAALLIGAAGFCLAVSGGHAEEIPPATDPAPVGPVSQEIKTPVKKGEPKMTAHVLEDVTATYYCCCEECCGKTDGITASGRKGIPGYSAAVDPDIIPLGTILTVCYENGNTETYRADDVGGAVTGAHIDLMCETHAEALAKGRAVVKVMWMEEAK